MVIDSTPDGPKEGETWTWQRQIVAPVQTLLSVRTSSQQQRAKDELDLAVANLKAQGFKIDVINFDYPSDPLAPLSWHLTELQQRKIGEAFTRPDLKPFKDKLTTALHCDAFAR